MITHHPDDDMWGRAGSAVIDSMADTLRYVQRVVQRILAESELAATARLSAPDVPAAGNAGLLAVLALVLAAAMVALVLAAAALAVTTRTRRYPAVAGRVV